MSDTEVLHENESYRVILSMDGKGYDMVNIKTGITEKQGTCLPSSISECEQSNAYLLNRTWQWIRIQSDKENEQGAEFYMGSDKAYVPEDGSSEIN